MKPAGVAMVVAGMACSAVAVAAAPAAPSAKCRQYGAEAFNAWTLGLYTAVGQHFGPDMRVHLPPTVLEEMWTDLQARVGKFRSLGAFRPSTLGGHAAMVAPMEFADMHMVAVYACNAKDQIAGLQILDPARVPELQSLAAPKH